jgi:predicted phage terminase large subunit-like protein
MLRRVWATENYADYVEYVHGGEGHIEIVDGKRVLVGGKWIWDKHNRFLCKAVQDLLDTETGNPYDILAISMPPQHGKSRTVTETLPSYFLGRNPYKRVIVAAYNDDLANQFGRKNLDKVKQFGPELFGIQVAKSPNSVSYFELDNKAGACLSKGLRSGITGRPAELFIIDDPTKDPMEAESLVHRERVWTEWLQAIKARFAPGTKVLIISTRWHEDDLIGRVLQSEGDVDSGGVVQYINLPCEAEENDPIGRKPGDPLFPNIGRDAEWVRKTKAGYMRGVNTGGPSAWYALFQGRPKIRSGNMFKESWFNFWYPRTSKNPGAVAVEGPDGNMINKDALPLPLEFDELLQSWDCTFKDEITSDFVVGTVWGRRGIDYYLLDIARRQMSIVDTMYEIERLSDKWPNARLKLIEDKANGPAVIQLLRNKITGLVAIPAIKSKAGRAQATMSDFESGHVFIPHPIVHRWSWDVINEFTSFPNGIHDDIVDSCVHALNRFDSNTANQTRVVGSAEHIIQTGEGWKPSISKPFHRTAKGRARVV